MGFAQQSCFYWKKAIADYANKDALCLLARLHESSYEELIQPDPAKAFALLTQTATKKHPQAAFSLWVIYSQGVNKHAFGVAKDTDIARVWLQRAVLWSDPAGQYVLGKGYLE